MIKFPKRGGGVRGERGTSRRNPRIYQLGKERCRDIGGGTFDIWCVWDKWENLQSTEQVISGEKKEIRRRKKD